MKHTWDYILKQIKTQILNTMITEKEISDMAETLQNDCHKMVKEVFPMTSKDVKIEDLNMVWIFRKLAELQLRVDELYETRHNTVNKQ